MNAFQILDKDGIAITIGQLDKEAAEFWGKEIHPKWYVNPTPPFTNSDNLEGIELIRAKSRHIMGNWFDTIGIWIANQGNYTSGWNNVIVYAMAESIGRSFINTDNKEKIEIYYPEYEDLDEDSCKITITNNQLNEIYGTMMYFKPYIELMQYWQSKGYIPKQIIK